MLRKKRLVQVVALLGSAVLLAVAALLIWGLTLPEEHTATAAALIPAALPDVFDRIAQPETHPSWRKDVKSVAMAGKDRWVEDGDNGRIPFQLIEASRPARLVVRIDSTDLPFEGTWTYSLHPVGSSTEVRITEDGRIKNPMFRSLSRLFFPPDKTMRTVLASLRESFESDLR